MGIVVHIFVSNEPKSDTGGAARFLPTPREVFFDLTIVGIMPYMPHLANTTLVRAKKMGYYRSLA